MRIGTILVLAARNKSHGLLSPASTAMARLSTAARAFHGTRPNQHEQVNRIVSPHCAFQRHVITGSSIRKLKPSSSFLTFERTLFLDRRSHPAIFRSDGISMSNNELVYNSRGDNYIIFGQLTVNCSSLMISAWLGALSLGMFSLNTTVMSGLECGIILGSFTSMVALVGAVTTRYLMRVYYNETEDVFTLVFASIIPLRRTTIVCKRGEVKYKEGGLGAMLLGQYYLKGKRFIILDHHFKQPAYYNMLLGYGQNENKEELDKES